MVDLSLQTLTHYLKLFQLPWSLEQLNGFVEHVIIDRRGKKKIHGHSQFSLKTLARLHICQLWKLFRFRNLLHHGYFYVRKSESNMLKHQVKYAINNSNLYITSDGLKSQAF